jgi:hypothetical protein
MAAYLQFRIVLGAPTSTYRYNGASLLCEKSFQVNTIHILPQFGCIAFSRFPCFEHFTRKAHILNFTPRILDQVFWGQHPTWF